MPPGFSWESTLRLLRRLFGSEPDAADPAPPTDYARPDRTPAFVVADGFGSCSVASRETTFRPWVEIMRPRIADTVPGARVCGFSYRGPGTHYGPADTARVQLALARQRLVEAYAPPLGVPTTFLAFSIAAPLFTLGLADALQRGLIAPAGLRGLILVQPALALQPDFVSSAAVAMGDAIPAPLVEIGRKSDALRERFLRAASVVNAHATLPMRIIYWPEDPFTPYAEGLRRALAQAAPVCRQVPLSFSDKIAKRPFIQHGSVNARGEIIEEIARVLAEDSAAIPP